MNAPNPDSANPAGSQQRMVSLHDCLREIVVRQSIPLLLQFLRYLEAQAHGNV